MIYLIGTLFKKKPNTKGYTSGYSILQDESGMKKYPCLLCRNIYQHKFNLIKHQRYEFGNLRTFSYILLS